VQSSVVHFVFFDTYLNAKILDAEISETSAEYIHNIPAVRSSQSHVPLLV